MSRKRRADATEYLFKFYNCATVEINVSGKPYLFLPVVMAKAKALAPYEQALFSLYRDLSKSASVKTIYGIKAVCLDDFNAEGHCCKVQIFLGDGKDELIPNH